MSVKGIKGVVPHDGRLQDVATPSVQHEQSLVHLHGFVCVWVGKRKVKKNGGRKNKKTMIFYDILSALTRRQIPAVWKLSATSCDPQSHMGRGS